MNDLFALAAESMLKVYGTDAVLVHPYSDEEKKRDEIMYQKMLDLAIKDSNDPNNYKNSMDRLNSK